MKILLLTSALSEVARCISGFSGCSDFAIVDFSDNCITSGYCKKHNIACIPFISWEQLADAFNGFDLLVSYKINRIIPMEFAGSFTFGGINVHPSMLPQYPGLNPWFRMYCDMNLDSGVTIHKISRQPDCGNIIAQHPLRIEPGEPLPVAMKNADRTAARLMSEVLENRLYLKWGVKQKGEHIAVRDIDLESLKRWPVKRLWHILRGFPNLIPTLYPELPHEFFEAGDYTEGRPRIPHISGLERSGTEYRIVCSDGFIRLGDFSLIPMTRDYIEAVKHSYFPDEIMKKLVFIENPEESPIYVQGREAIVFKAKSGGEVLAVRFPRNIPSQETGRYIARQQAIQAHIKNHGIKHFPDFTLVPDAVELQGKGVFPATIMKWHEGKTLMEFLWNNLEEKGKLNLLLNEFKTVCRINRKSGTVHGDIHSSNIIVDENGSIALLDADGIWCPDMGKADDKGGNRNWQHPARFKNKYLKPGIDNFSEAVVCATIMTAMSAPDIFRRHASESLLFSESDYTSPGESPLLAELSGRPECKGTSRLVSALCHAESLGEIPTAE